MQRSSTAAPILPPLQPPSKNILKLACHNYHLRMATWQSAVLLKIGHRDSEGLLVQENSSREDLLRFSPQRVKTSETSRKLFPLLPSRSKSRLKTIASAFIHTRNSPKIDQQQVFKTALRREEEKATSTQHSNTHIPTASCGCARPCLHNSIIIPSRTETKRGSVGDCTPIFRAYSLGSGRV